MIAQIINLNDRIDHKDKMNVDRPNLFLIDPSSSKTIIYRKNKEENCEDNILKNNFLNLIDRLMYRNNFGN